MADVQIDNGNFTRIHNEILEHLVSANLNGTELAVVLFVLRKTYGFNKLQDEISLSQFTNAIPVSKETICSALYKLQLVKIIRLVKKGSSKLCSNLWAFNKNYDTWQLVKKTKLVKISRRTSQDLPLPTSQDFLTHKRQRTKDNTKDIRSKMSEEDFTLIWNVYPRHDGGRKKPRDKCLKLDHDLLPRILEAIETQKSSPQWQKDNGQFIPYLITWLNQERWEEEKTNSSDPRFE